MDSRRIGHLSVLTPDLDPRDLEPVDQPPTGEGLLDCLVDGATWPGVELAGIECRLSQFTRVDLARSTWHECTVYGCRFDRVDLSSARLPGTAIERCEFVGCRLTGVQLSACSLKNVTFEDCRIDYANLTQVRGTGAVAVTGGTLDNSHLAHCSLPGAVITNCELGRLEFDRCDLTGADLRHCDLSQIMGIASLRGAVVTSEQVGDLAA